MNKNTKVLLLAVITLIIAGIAIYPTAKKMLAGNNSHNGIGKDINDLTKRGSGRPLNVKAMIMRPTTLIDEVKASKALLIPDEEVELTFESPGKITEILFSEGSAVKKCELLAKINDKPLKAELQKLEAQIPLAEDRVFRQKSLLEKDAVSRETYEQVSTDLEKLKADIDLVKAQIAQTELRAPFDGMVGLRNVSEGAYASTTTIITKLTKTIPLKLEFYVPEKNAADVNPGKKITFRLPPDRKEYHATIYATDSRMDPNTISMKVRAIYPNTGGKLQPGRSADVTIQTNEIRNALAVPSEAVVKEMGRDVAYIYSGGKAQKTEIETGIRTESMLQALSGLSAGDTLLVSGVMQLRDGLPVEIGEIR
ncbi:MAG: efflux RND transporter periplasmic adaptor subunit [Dysgonamonadaceae bacterium]|jgi:membrane fusion protein (multidrug efflux system)|nr:efflux RND transporter periplasmic adaptor subunit [Dysgonamonadaceae bacterium]